MIAVLGTQSPCVPPQLSGLGAHYRGLELCRVTVTHQVDVPYCLLGLPKMNKMASLGVGLLYAVPGFSNLCRAILCPFWGTQG